MNWPYSLTFVSVASSVAVAAGCGDPPKAGVQSDAKGQYAVASDASGDATSSWDAGAPVEELIAIDVAAPGILVTDLSASQQVALCDWTAQELGGYGSGGIPCPDNATSAGIGAPSGVEDCVMTYPFNLWGPDCPLTVGDFQSCVLWQVQNVCNIVPANEPLACKTLNSKVCVGSVGTKVFPDAAPDAATVPDGADDTSPSGDDTSEASVGEASPGVVDAEIDDANSSPD